MHTQNKIVDSPKGKAKFKWLGPAFIWMLSAAGSGEVLFTPRIASQYGYALVWALLIAVSMKWFINREIGRYTVCTGATFFRGIASIENKKWLLWFIVIPQLLVAVATISGLAGAASTAVVLLVDWPLWIPATIIILLMAAVIISGGFNTIEKLATILAIVISLSVLGAAISVGPDWGKMADGLVPNIPPETKVDEVLSWLGFILAGAAGMMWFSYWTAARGYGASSLNQTEPIDPGKLPEEQKKNLKSWTKFMTLANTLAVVGALLVAFAFLILGTELLQPKGLVPEESKVARVLGELMGGVWGRLGFWFMVTAVFITFISTILSDQDGFGRMFADGMLILSGKRKRQTRWLEPDFLKKFFVIVVLAIFPIIAQIMTSDPVSLLKLGGVIEAAHIPVVTALILYLNKKHLPREFQPSGISFGFTVLAGIFFALFAILYILQLTGVVSL